jgi:hypothetical protein
MTGPDLASAAVRIAVWTMRHGGDRREEVAVAVAGLKPDLAIIPEFRRDDGRGDLRNSLRRQGFSVQIDSAPPPASNGVLVAAVHRAGGALKCAPAGSALGPRAVRVDFAGLPILAVSAPSPRGGTARQAEFAATLAVALRCAVGPWILGDLKTAGGRDGTVMGRMHDRLLARGYRRLGATERLAPHILLPAAAARAVRDVTVVAAGGLSDLSDRPAVLITVSAPRCGSCRLLYARLR